MEVENVLLALEEREKWIKRRKKLQKRLAKVQKRKKSVLKDLEKVRKQVSHFEEILTSLKDAKGPVDTPTASPLR
jgi:chromosome segregation ATPase